MARIKHGIIGTGGMARGHAGAFNKVRGVEVFGCYDVAPGRAEAFARDHGVRHAMDSLDDLLDACDAVSIVTPDAFHAELSLKALGAGKHVLCEKPLTTTLADARKVARAAETAAQKHGVVHMVNFSYRNSSQFQQALRIAGSGRLGAIRHVTGRYFQAWLASTVWGNPATHEAWLWRQQVPAGGGKAAGGTLGDIGCHILDFTTAFAGDIKALRCTARTFPKLDPVTGEPYTRYRGRKLDANDSILMELELVDGGLGSIEATRWAVGHTNQVALGVYGTEGAIEINLEPGDNYLRTCLGKMRHRPEWKRHEPRPTPSIYQRFAKSIKTGDNNQPDIVRGAQIQAYLDACERSAEDGGKRVTIRRWV